MRVICELETQKPGITDQIYQEIEGEAKELLAEMIKAGIVKNQFQAGIVLKAYFLFGKTQEHWENFRDMVEITDPKIALFRDDLAQRVDTLKSHLRELLPDPAMLTFPLEPTLELLAVQALDQISSQDPLSNFCQLVTETRNPTLANTLREDKN